MCFSCPLHSPDPRMALRGARFGQLFDCTFGEVDEAFEAGSDGKMYMDRLPRADHPSPEPHYTFVQPSQHADLQLYTWSGGRYQRSQAGSNPTRSATAISIIQQRIATSRLFSIN